MNTVPERLRVLELCEGIAGPLCGRHLALLGAHVERVEPSGGDPARAWGRHAPGALHAQLAEGKAAGTPDALATADVVLADEWRIDAAALPDRGVPRLVVLFERETLADGALVAGDTVAQAVLGMTDYVSDRWSAPARTGADLAAVNAGVAGVQAVLAWLLAPKAAGVAVVRVSALRALAALKTVIWAARTAPDVWSGSHVVARDRAADGGYRVADGWVTIDFPHDRAESWQEFCAAIDVDERVRASGDRWWETVGWGDDVDLARPHYEAALARLSREEAAELVRRHGGSSVPFHTSAEVLAHPQTRALDARPSRLPWRTLDGGACTGLARPRADGLHNWPHPPLAGLRVVDFGVGGVAPFAGALLAQLGASVVKVEAPNEFIHAVRPTANGLSTTYSALNVGKRSTDLNLKQPADLARARELVAGADVVLENFRPGAMDRLGLGYRDVAALSPRAVYVSASGFGSVGPLSALPCTDPHIQAFAGWAHTNAGPDGAPRRTRYYALLDLVTSMVIVEGALAALLARTRSAEGAHVEVSMVEAVVHLHVTRWTGAESPVAERLYAPDGIFPTTDGHLAVSVENDAQWAGLLAALGHPAALAREEWATNPGRLADEAALTAALTEQFAHRSSQGWVQALARHGVPAGRLTHDDDAVLRRDLWERGHLVELRRAPAPPLPGGGSPSVHGGGSQSLAAGGSPPPPADGSPPLAAGGPSSLAAGGSPSLAAGGPPPLAVGGAPAQPAGGPPAPHAEKLPALNAGGVPWVFEPALPPCEAPAPGAHPPVWPVDDPCASQ